MSSYVDPKYWMSVFNTPLEYGLRATVIMTEVYPEAFDIQRILYYDYLLVHSHDFDSVIPNAPRSIHPPTPNRASELTIRREQCQVGLRLMISRGVVACQLGDTGISYKATDIALPFLDNLSSIYVSKIRQVAHWLNINLGDLSDEKLRDLISQHLGQWGAEFVMPSVLFEKGQDT